MMTDAIVRSFRQGREMFQAWRDVTAQEHPNHQDLLERLQQDLELTISKLVKSGWITTDTCNAARKFRNLLMVAITEIAREEGMSEEDIPIYEAGKWVR